MKSLVKFTLTAITRIFRAKSCPVCSEALKETNALSGYLTCGACGFTTAP